jgi:hypothetical protein
MLLAFRADGTYTSRSGAQMPTWVAPWKVRGVADFNGDGKADVLLHAEQAGNAADGQTVLHLFTSDSYVTVSSPATPGFSASLYEVKGTGDFNGDGRADLFVHGRSGTAVDGQTLLYLFDADGSAHPPVGSPNMPGFDGQVFAVRGIADFDGDGRSDIMIHREEPGSPEDGKTYLYLFDGDATSYRTVAYPTTPAWNATVFKALPIVDWDGDGRADLIIHGTASGAYSGQTIVYLSEGDGSFSVLSGSAAPSFASPPWTVYPGQ